MTLSKAQSLAWNLSRTLMTIIVLVRTVKGFSAIPLTEYDGDPEEIIREYDPFAI